jgi:uncharacterized membrane protein
VSFGALTVAVRFGLARRGAPVAGTVVITTSAAIVALAATAARGGLDRIDLAVLWPFALIGFAVPGVSQIVFAHAVRAIGPSRSGVLIGTAPLVSAIIAVAALGERPHAVLGAATLLVVAGGVLLAWERTRPADFRAIGVAFALACAVMFGTRDNLVRLAADGRDADPFAGATVSLAAAALSTLAWYTLVERGGVRAVLPCVGPFLPAGAALGLGYVTLVAAFDAGEVTLVAPLTSTQGLWAVALSALVLGRAERVGWRLVLAAGLIVSGSVLVGLFR